LTAPFPDALSLSAAAAPSRLFVFEGEAMAADEGYVTASDGVRLFFRTAGSGAQVVVVPNGMYLVDEFAPLTEGRTLVFFDLRNRGRSDAIDPNLVSTGILQDTEDVAVVSRHFSGERLNVVGHSFAGVIAALAAINHPERVDRAIQLGPMAPNPDAQYPAHLTNIDAVFVEIMTRLRELQAVREQHDPEEFCRMVWAVLGPLYVTDRRDAHRINWWRCDLANERQAMRYYSEVTVPSIRALDLGTERCAAATASVLIIHGTLDRSAPYGAGRDWALRLPNARLLTVADGGHAPWIEAPDTVFSAMRTFLDGGWPAGAEVVDTLDPLQ